MATLADITPEEMAALQQIARLRAAGFDDATIFGGGNMTIGGGFGYLPYITDLAGITSQYNLGRGGLAAEQLARQDRLVANPFNVVAANQFYADQGGSPFLTDPTLASVPKSPASRYQEYIDSLLFPGGQVPGGGITPSAQQNVEAAYARDPVAAEQFFASASGGTARPQEQVAASMANTAQTQSAQQLGAQLPGMSSPQFGTALRAGQTPGFSSFTQADFGKLSPDQRAQYFANVQATGRVSDAASAYEDFARKYRAWGSYTGGTAR